MGSVLYSDSTVGPAKEVDLIGYLFIGEAEKKRKKSAWMNETML